MRKVISRQCILAALLSLWAISASANEAREHCEQMYPTESYEPKERIQYIQECRASMGEDLPTTDEEGFYSGTVEDFVETVPQMQDENKD